MSFFTNQMSEYAAYEIGDWTYGNPRVMVYGEPTTLKIGKFCSIAEGVTIMLGGNHRVDWVTTYPFSAVFPQATVFPGHPLSKGNVIIGNDVWIGKDALILSGITLGNGAVVAARSVVTKNVPPYAIVGGNPARVIRFRFPDHAIVRLQNLQWWDWPIEKIQATWPLLLSNDVEQFLNTFGR